MSERLPIEASIWMPGGRRVGIEVNESGNGIKRLIDLPRTETPLDRTPNGATRTAMSAESKLGKRVSHGKPESDLPFTS